MVLRPAAAEFTGILRPRGTMSRHGTFAGAQGCLCHAAWDSAPLAYLPPFHFCKLAA
jgi:hypothetical protein